jgi:hypothetical protein
MFNIGVVSFCWTDTTLTLNDSWFHFSCLTLGSCLLRNRCGNNTQWLMTFESFFGMTFLEKKIWKKKFWKKKILKNFFFQNFFFQNVKYDVGILKSRSEKFPLIDLWHSATGKKSFFSATGNHFSSRTFCQERKISSIYSMDLSLQTSVCSPRSRANNSCFLNIKWQTTNSPLRFITVFSKGGK